MIMTVQQPSAELNTQLKKLGLSGMLNSVEIRNQQSLRGQLAYCEFLSLLPQDELLVCANRSYGHWLKLASLNGNKIIENFNFRFNPKIDQGLTHDLATPAWCIEQAKSTSKSVEYHRGKGVFQRSLSKFIH